MVGRASATRELGSPAARPDLVSLFFSYSSSSAFLFHSIFTYQSRRSSSRASQRTAPAPDLNTSLTQSSYSLPPTPLTSSFDEFLPSAKRRRTQRAVDSEDKTASVTETPTHRAFSEPFQASKSHSSARPTRASNLTQSNTQTQVQDTSIVESGVETPSRSKSIPLASEQAQTDQPQTDQPEEDSVTSKRPSRQQSVSVKAEPDKDNTMGAVQSRKTRKSVPAQLELDQENGNLDKTSTSPAPTQTPRRDRKSRLSANTGAKITKPAPAAKNQTPSTKGKALENGTSSTPAKQPASTPNTSTRSSRRDRKSTRATPVSSQPVQNENERPESQSPNKFSNTVKLNVGRKSLESIMAQNEPQDHEMIDTPGQENGDYHFDYDAEMYGNNFGLDGAMDAPTSPNSLSTSTSTAARTSGRTRKPTIRALESRASEQRHRRPRAPSAKPAESSDALETMQSEKPAYKSPAPSHKPDVLIIAKQIYELAAAAVAPGFVSAPEVETWLKELRQKVDDKAKEREVVQPAEPEPQSEPQPEPEHEVEVEAEPEPAPAPEAGPEPEREATPEVDKLYRDNVQVSAPWTDADGWEHTGQVNKYEEEYVIFPSTYEWTRPNNTYGDEELPLPPIRVRSLVQGEKDRAFGYPPRIGDRNLPIDNKGMFLFEDVLVEKSRIDIREAARSRGIWVNRFWTPDQIETIIQRFDDGKSPIPPEMEIAPVEVKPKESSRKRRRTDTASVTKHEPVDTPRPKRRRRGTDATSPDSSGDSSAKTCNVTLKFADKRSLVSQILNGSYRVNPSNKPTVQKPSSEDAHTPTTPAKATDEKLDINETPGSAETPNDTTPGGRPRRRAADALMANFQKHAEARAQRAERARIGHARRKAGTPLKTVTGVGGDTVESPIRPTVDPMNLD
ncbi:hypothetical protein BDV18DRAFT_142837 [Aspergillus unguis]